MLEGVLLRVVIYFIIDGLKKLKMLKRKAADDAVTK
jgi:hypothetical protein